MYDVNFKIYFKSKRKTLNGSWQYEKRKKKVFHNWPCNSLYLYDVNVNGQVAWVTIHRIYNATDYNSIKITRFQLLCNSFIIVLMMSC
jgi:hypothetical protein